MIKFCNKCQHETERSPRGDCKACVSRIGAAWKAANADRVKVSNAEWKAANKEKVNATKRAWRATRPDIEKGQTTKWRAANTEHRRSYRAAWYEKNGDVERASNVEWYAAHPEARVAYQNNRRARKNSAGGTHTAQDIKRLFDLQRGKCSCCKTSINGGYHVDHIIPLALGGRNDRMNLQLLCPTCNLRKGAKHPQEFMQQQGFLL